MEMQKPGYQIGVLESLDDARAFGVVFDDIFKGKYKLKRMGCYIAASDKLQYITVRSIGEACCHWKFACAHNMYQYKIKLRYYMETLIARLPIGPLE